jgi:hypothetical protein
VKTLKAALLADTLHAAEQLLLKLRCLSVACDGAQEIELGYAVEELRKRAAALHADAGRAFHSAIRAGTVDESGPDWMVSP